MQATQVKKHGLFIFSSGHKNPKIGYSALLSRIVPHPQSNALQETNPSPFQRRKSKTYYKFVLLHT